MSKLDLKYGLDHRPPAGELLLYGLQWLAISVPSIIIIGKVVAGLHFTDTAGQSVYLQKLFFISGLAMLCQLLWGHRLPLVTGPAAVLLVGVVAAGGADAAGVYTSILVGGLVLFGLSAGGLFGRLAKLFTPRVVAVILLLIAFTLAPTIIRLIFPAQAATPPLFNMGFAVTLVLLMLVAGKLSAGIWKSTIIIWFMAAGSFVYLLAVPGGDGPVLPGGGGFAASFLTDINFELMFQPGTLFSFLVCFLALSINDLGSMQSVGELLKPPEMPKRIARGISLSGLANALSGLFGVIGPVNYSLSPGIIASTGCASRFTLLPAAAGLTVISFLPAVIAMFGAIPSLVIGAVMLYIMCSQVAAGLMAAFGPSGIFKLESGLIMGLPLMLGIIVSFLPAPVVETFPATLAPVLGNGFVAGVLAVLLLEHVVYREVDTVD